MTIYHVNVQQAFERDLYVAAESAEEAEEKVRQKAGEDPTFWAYEHWDLAPEAPEDYFVEESLATEPEF